MGGNTTKEINIFMLQAIEYLALAVLKDDYDPDEIHGIYQQAGIHLYDLEK